MGTTNQYIDGLEDVKELLKGHTEPVVLHTDQKRRKQAHSRDVSTFPNSAGKIIDNVAKFCIVRIDQRLYLHETAHTPKISNKSCCAFWIRAIKSRQWVVLISYIQRI